MNQEIDAVLEEMRLLRGQLALQKNGKWITPAVQVVIYLIGVIVLAVIGWTRLEYVIQRQNEDRTEMKQSIGEVKNSVSTVREMVYQHRLGTDGLHAYRNNSDRPGGGP